MNLVVQSLSFSHPSICSIRAQAATGYLPRWLTCPQVVTHPITNKAVHGPESNSCNLLITSPMLRPFHCQAQEVHRNKKIGDFVQD